MFFREKTTVLNILQALVFFLGFMTLAGCSGHRSAQVHFSPSDLESEWAMIGFGQRVSGPFHNHGSMVVGQDGSITGGIVHNVGVNIQNITEGSLVIAPDGMVTGTRDLYLKDTDSTGTERLLAGQMSARKDLIACAVDFTFGRRGVGVLVKKSGAFGTPDLEGDWLLPLDGQYSFSVDKAGAVTDCAYLTEKGLKSVCEGAFSINSEGAVSGVMKGAAEMSFDGQMNAYKDLMLLAGGTSTRFYGVSGPVVRNATFSTNDLEGKWRLFLPQTEHVLYGTVEISAEGNIKQGIWTSGKNSGSFGSGRITRTVEDGLGGALQTSSEKTYTIFGGMMNASKNFLVLSQRDEAGSYGTAIMVRVSVSP
jgi:hypothetical protein